MRLVSALRPSQRRLVLAAALTLAAGALPVVQTVHASTPPPPSIPTAPGLPSGFPAPGQGQYCSPAFCYTLGGFGL